MSLGKFHELRVKKQLLFEKAQEKKRLEPQESESSDEEDLSGARATRQVERVSSKQLKAVDAYGKSILSVKNLEPPGDRIEEFGNLSMGIKPATHMVSCTRERLNEMKDFYGKDKENLQKFYGNQKEVHQLIKTQTMKDSVKQFVY
jgi:hypothetical protein